MGDVSILSVVSGLVVASVVSAIGYGVWRFSRLTDKQKKFTVKRYLPRAWRWLEDRDLVMRTPAFIHDYHKLYPSLKILEANHKIIQRECLELMAHGDRLPHMTTVGGRYTLRGVHDIAWTTYMFKMGRFFKKNCQRAPETTRLLERIPDLHTAFFSILGPNQHIRPHWGYYKGFLRYHLGLVIPNDNADECCWLRVNDDQVANDSRNRKMIEEAEKYYWHEGEGIVFDDTYLHDAANESSEPRAVLFLDLRRPLPWYLHYPSLAFVWLAHLVPSVREIRRGVIFDDE
jgi:aspartyl/asparaginyl beta-hydroxylase (cupin superfamily)